MNSLLTDVPTVLRQHGQLSDRWFAVDWGTTNLRAWQLDKAGNIIQAYASDQGAGDLSPQDFEKVLIALIGRDLKSDARRDVFCCGMVGSKLGWVEAGYRPVPASHELLPSDIVCFDAGGGKLRVHILPGRSLADPADVMRGEETQIAGYFAGKVTGEIAICCPGTHSKWALANHNGIQTFKTLPTGELFALLSQQSILRHSMGPHPIEPDVFAQAVAKAADAPENLLSELFPIRARDLLETASGQSGKSRLSGLLIGLELANARPFWLDRPTVIIGAGELADLYALALATFGAECSKVDGGDMVRAGLARARLAFSRSAG